MAKMFQLSLSLRRFPESAYFVVLVIFTFPPVFVFVTTLTVLYTFDGREGVQLHAGLGEIKKLKYLDNKRMTAPQTVRCYTLVGFN